MERADRLALEAAKALDRQQDAREQFEQAGQALSRVEATGTKGRVALWLSGTTRREQRDVADHCRAVLNEARGRMDEAGRDADNALMAAWTMVTDSSFANRLGLPADRPVTPGALRAAVRTMAGRLPTLAEQVDLMDTDAVRSLRQQAAASQQRAQEFTASAAEIGAERALREEMRRQAPIQYRAEDFARQSAARAEAVPARPAVPAVAAHRQQPPSQGPRLQPVTTNHPMFAFLDYEENDKKDTTDANLHTDDEFPHSVRDRGVQREAHAQLHQRVLRQAR
ncbi:hypothetical protein [Streptomyces cucumeris]|uniref:hypothetical protein n=1 Tax=Streptomyces cucumeris TaxID=2962890 RepID=UPI003D7528E2